MQTRHSALAQTKLNERLPKHTSLHGVHQDQEFLFPSQNEAGKCVHG
jgi:hypothetical protein